MVRILGRLVYSQAVLNPVNNLIEVGQPHIFTCARPRRLLSAWSSGISGMGGRLQDLFNHNDATVRAGAQEAWRAMIATFGLDRTMLLKERRLKLLMDPLALTYEPHPWHTAFPRLRQPHPGGPWAARVGTGLRTTTTTRATRCASWHCSPGAF